MLIGDKFFVSLINKKKFIAKAKKDMRLELYNGFDGFEKDGGMLMAGILLLLFGDLHGIYKFATMSNFNNQIITSFFCSVMFVCCDLKISRICADRLCLAITILFLFPRFGSILVFFDILIPDRFFVTYSLMFRKFKTNLASVKQIKALLLTLKIVYVSSSGAPCKAITQTYTSKMEDKFCFLAVLLLQAILQINFLPTWMVVLFWGFFFIYFRYFVLFGIMLNKMIPPMSNEKRMKMFENTHFDMYKLYQYCFKNGYEDTISDVIEQDGLLICNFDKLAALRCLLDVHLPIDIANIAVFYAEPLDYLSLF